MRDYASMPAWQAAHRLCLETYRATDGVDDSHWSVVLELRRAALRVPATLARASAFESGRRFGKFVSLSLAFAVETQYLLGLATEFECIPGRRIEATRSAVAEAIEQVFRLLEEAHRED